VRPPTDPWALVKAVAMTSQDPWPHFYAVANGGGEVIGASAAEGMWGRLSCDSCVI
jgi:hypothetical protein